MTPAERWSVQLAVALSKRGIAMADPLIIARTGWTTAELAAGIIAEAPDGPFDLVSLLIGVNNQYRGLDIDIYRSELCGLLEQAIGFAGGRAERVLVLSIPDWGVTPFAEGRDRTQIAVEIDAYNQIKNVEAQRAGTHFIEVTAISRQAANFPDLLAVDGLHPSGKMYAAWVELMLPVVLDAVSLHPASFKNTSSLPGQSIL